MQKNIKKSDWLHKAEYRKQNRKWLNYSSNITRRLLAAIEDKKDFNQTTLAKLLDVSPQNISKILKGQENLSLKTIAQLSEAIGVELISFPDYKYGNIAPKTYILKMNGDEPSYSGAETPPEFLIEESKTGIKGLEEIIADVTIKS